MVSKVAVIALVAVIAVPILLGYAMNLNETTITNYETSGDPINVTQLLENGTAYTSAMGNAYDLNTRVSFSSFDYPVLPLYITRDLTVKTPLPYSGSYFPWGGGVIDVTYAEEFNIQFDTTQTNDVYVSVNIYKEGGVLYRSYDHVRYIDYNKSEGEIVVWYNANLVTINGADVNYFDFILTGMATVPILFGIIYQDGVSNYADISGGFLLRKTEFMTGSSGWKILLPENTTSYLLTINLNRTYAPNYILELTEQHIELVKSIVNGAVTWKLYKDRGTLIEQSLDLYYNPNINDNTYQIYIQNSDQIETTNDPSTFRYFNHIEARYVGHWPQLIGEANYYQKYELDYSFTSSNGSRMDYIFVNIAGDVETPALRVDAAAFKAFEYAVINNNTYNPSSFKTNPATTIKNIDLYGTSLTFGGITYNVSNGNITIDSHKLPIEKLIFKSAPNGSGGYDNMIGNTLISSTAQPSTITFNGKWSATVETKEMSSVTITETEWTAGEFAWDGIDTNFLIVGIMTAFAAMIGVGIYAKNRRMPIIPLVLVCGCAAYLFFLLI